MRDLCEISMDDILYTHNLSSFYERKGSELWWKNTGDKIVEALRKDINNPRYQWVFKPIRVNWKGHLKKYRVGDGRKRYYIHRKLGLKTIKAEIYGKI